jgi:hypothetical protein
MMGKYFCYVVCLIYAKGLTSIDSDDSRSIFGKSEEVWIEGRAIVA